jgi:ferrous iron transport protein B
MDKPLRKIGLSGRSFAPMLMGFGCSVPAIMATRTLPGEKDRKMTVLLTPFMSCSAKLPIYAIFTAAFFEEYRALVMMSLYIIGAGLGILSGYVMNKTIFRGNPAPFLMELPNYRFPSLKTALLLMWDKAKDFLQRACTIILAATIIIWFLQSFDVRFNPVEGGDGSILAMIGRSIVPIFEPLGFSDWRVTTALITGFTAKEAVISTLAVLTGAGAAELGSSLGMLFTPLSAFSFLIFTLLYTPCVAAVATVRRELGSFTGTALVILYQTGFAWVIAFIVYNIGLLVV